jgi:hypothetical protein
MHILAGAQQQHTSLLVVSLLALRVCCCLQDKSPGKLPKFSGYAGVYRDVRAAVDLCHRDGSLKRHVAANPAKYIHDVSSALSFSVTKTGCCF